MQTGIQLVAGIGLLWLLTIVLLSACTNETMPTATAQPASPPAALVTPSATATLIPEPAATSDPRPASTSELPVAMAVLDMTAAAMDAVESVHMEIAIQYGGTEAETYVVVDLEPPERSHSIRTDKSGAFSIETELIVIGRHSYVKNSWTREWQTMAKSAAPSEDESAFGAFGADFALEMAERFSLVGREYLDGEIVYHVKGAISGKARADPFDDPHAENGGSEVEFWSGEAEYWIGVEDFLVRKVVLQTEVPVDKSIADSGADTQKMTYVAILSDYGKPVDIRAPEVEDFQRFSMDDLADGPDPANQVIVGEGIEGTIDHPSEYDMFNFIAEEDQHYQIDVTLGTLTDSQLTLYSYSGIAAAVSDNYGDSLASRILWVGSAGQYYLAVESADGNTGTYTLIITPVVPDSPTSE